MFPDLQTVYSTEIYHRLPLEIVYLHCICLNLKAKEMYSFDIHRTMHRNIFLQQNQPDTSLSQIYFSGVTLYMFWTVFPPVIRSSRLYILQQAFVKQILLSACQRSRQQVDSSMCSLELLMMDGKTVRNMQSVTSIK